MQESALREGVDLLTAAREAILSRGYSPSTYSCLRRVVAQLTKARAGVWKKNLLSACHRLQRDVAREVADFPLSLKYNDGLRTVGLERKRQRDTNVELRKARLDYEDAVILTSLRSYSVAAESFTILARSYKIQECGEWTSATQARRRATQWLRQNRNDPDMVREAVRLVRRYMMLELLRGQAMRLAHRKQQKAILESELVYLNANYCYHFAAELLRFVPSDVSRFDYWENARLRGQMGTVLAALRRDSEALRRLEEAETFVRNADVSDRLSLGIINLRRAEVLLQLARRKPAFRRLVRRVNRGHTAPPTLLTEVRELRPVQRSLMLIDKASECLEIAEDNLRGHRRNVWWWTLLYELQMKAIEFFQVVKCCTNAEERRDEAREFASRFEQRTHAWKPRELVRDAERIIRIDAFRMARIVESYWRITTATSDRDESELRDLGQRVQSVLTEREKVERPLDEDVKRYVDMVVRATDTSKKRLPRRRK